MRIALLNFPLDNNYGGNLQRFALMRVLENMGHDVTHLNRQRIWQPDWYVPEPLWKRWLKQKLNRPFPDFSQCECNLDYVKENIIIQPFYGKYIKHTEVITPYDDMRKYDYFDAYIVGSDQIWRYDFVWGYTYPSVFFDFVKHKRNIKRIAYGISFGNSEVEIPQEMKRVIDKLYKKFDFVSVREDTGIDVLSQLGWTSPQAVQVLDPTLLLNKEDYINIVKEADTMPSPGDMFCYVIDQKNETDALIEKLATEKKLVPFKISLNLSNAVSIEQWLRSFMDAEFILTDSYHGFVFSIIFNKPVKLILNDHRGSDRYMSLMRLLDYNPEAGLFDWDRINNKLKVAKLESFRFLKEGLS